MAEQFPSRSPYPLAICPCARAIPGMLVISRRLKALDHWPPGRACGDRFHHAVEVEAAGLLPRRELAEALQPVADDRPPPGRSGTSARCTSAGSPWRSPPRRARTGPCAGWSAAGARSSSNGSCQTPRPCGVLPQEGHLPVVVAQRRDAAVVGPVEELAARPVGLAPERGQRGRSRRGGPCRCGRRPACRSAAPP